MSKRIVVYLHGVGGPSQRDDWLKPLNQRLRGLRWPSIDPSSDKVLDIDYSDHVRRTEKRATPKETWRKPSDREYEQARLEYTRRQAGLASELRHVAGSSDFWSIGRAPEFLVGAVGPLVPGLADARLYRSTGRAHVLEHILAKMPSRGRIVLIGHSLGTVVAVDLIKRLAPDVRVELLVTLASPLPIPGMWRPAREALETFPYDRVERWLNIAGPDDFVTAGRGVSAFAPQAIDVWARIGVAHRVAAYSGHAALATAIGTSWWGPRDDSAPQNLPIRSVDRLWYEHFLRFAFSQQLLALADDDDWKWKGRLADGRRLIAEEIVADAVAEAAGNEDVPAIPSVDDLVENPVAVIDGAWTDEGLAPLVVVLLLSSPLDPFDFKISDKQRFEALEHLLDRVRKRGSAVSDKQYAQAVKDSIAAARKVFSGGLSGWDYALGVGVVLLGLTGVGLAAAVPAGLAGAAAITATLAAFGPGGMMGGMVAIAALTGTGTALVGAGLGGGNAQEVKAAVPGLAGNLAATFRRGSVDEVESILVTLLAVLELQRRVDLVSTAVEVEQLLVGVEVILASDRLKHESIAPGRDGTKQLIKKIESVQKAIVAVGRLIPDELNDIRSARLAAVTEGSKEN